MSLEMGGGVEYSRDLVGIFQSSQITVPWNIQPCNEYSTVCLVVGSHQQIPSRRKSNGTVYWSWMETWEVMRVSSGKELGSTELLLFRRPSCCCWYCSCCSILLVDGHDGYRSLSWYWLRSVLSSCNFCHGSWCLSRRTPVIQRIKRPRPLAADMAWYGACKLLTLATWLGVFYKKHRQVAQCMSWVHLLRQWECGWMFPKEYLP